MTAASIPLGSRRIWRTWRLALARLQQWLLQPQGAARRKLPTRDMHALAALSVSTLRDIGAPEQVIERARAREGATAELLRRIGPGI